MAKLFEISGRFTIRGRGIGLLPGAFVEELPIPKRLRLETPAAETVVVDCVGTTCLPTTATVLATAGRRVPIDTDPRFLVDGATVSAVE